MQVDKASEAKQQYVIDGDRRLAIKGNEDGTVSLLAPDGSVARNVAKGGFEAGGDRSTFFTMVMLIALSTIVIDILQGAMGSDRTPASMVFMILVMGFFGWPVFARVIRGQVLSLKEREFIEAARSLGANRRRIYFKELLPHLWAPILVYTTLVMPQNIATEAALGFLGVGIQAPTPSFGSILNDSVHYANSDPAYFIFPGITLFLVVLSFNLLGDGLRDALDPKADRQ